MFGGGPGIRLFGFKGIDVRLDISVLIMMLIFFAPLAQSLSRVWSPLTVGLTVTTVALLFLASILVHELGHAWMGLLLGAKVSGIQLLIFGGATYFSYKPSSEARNFWISIIGPISNLVLWAVFSVAQNFVEPYPPVSLVCQYLATANLFLAAFNALPGYPMDGGQALRSAIIWLTKKELLAARIVMVSGLLVGGLIGLWAVEAVIQQSFIAALFRGLIAFWIISGSMQQFRDAQRFQPQMPNQPDTKPQAAPVGVPVEQAMTRPPMAFAPVVRVGEFLQQTAQMGLNENTWLPVLREGYLMGLITPRMARKVSQSDQATATLESVMLARRNLLAIAADDDLSRATEAVQISKTYPVAVLGPGGQFAGLISRENLG